MELVCYYSYSYIGNIMLRNNTGLLNLNFKAEYVAERWIL